jgi:peptide/nickel transport system substrate-binding protein
VPFTSAAAEFDALRAGDVDYGYVPTTDVGAVGSLKASGYTIKPWYEWGLTWITINYSNPKYGPLVGQLYIRQAMEYLIDQPEYIKTILEGYGVPTYGPVPLSTTSRFLSQTAKKNPYPYSPRRAKRLLKAHGWTIPPGGIAMCTKPGPASDECGAGIAGGTKLELPLSYSNGFPTLAEEVEAMKTSFKNAGIELSIKSGTVTTVETAMYECFGKTMKTCPTSSPELSLAYSPSHTDVVGYDPTAGTVFSCGALTDGGNYCNAQVDSLINTADTKRTSQAFSRFESVLAKQLPFLWFPTKAYQISAISSKLAGVVAQGPNAYIYPMTWHLKS